MATVGLPTLGRQTVIFSSPVIISFIAHTDRLRQLESLIKYQSHNSEMTEHMENSMFLPCVQLCHCNQPGYVAYFFIIIIITYSLFTLPATCSGIFHSLVFGTISGMGADCNCFLKCIAEKLSEKNGEPYHISITCIKTLLSFKILRLLHTCVRGSRTSFHKIPHRDFIDDCHSYAISNLRSFKHFCFIFN